jgi:ABC-type uncharacterized transport system substrate-binding protein
MYRRTFIVLVGAAAGCPLAARAQQKAMPVIGILGFVSPEFRPVQLNLAALREGLAEKGYVEGQNVMVEYRWAERRLDRLPALAAELVARNVDVIVTEGGDATTIAAKHATSTIPVVFHTSSDPVAMGMVASLSHPGGNLTGVSMVSGELVPKLAELLLEVIPQAKLIGVLRDPTSLLDMTNAGNARGVRFEVLPAVTKSEVDAAFATLLQHRPDGLTAYTLNRQQIAALALGRASPRRTGSKAFTLGEFCKAKSRPICRCSNRRPSSWSST